MNTWEEIDRWRRAERERLVQARLAAGREQRNRWGRMACERLAAELGQAGPGLVIGFYWPYKGEVDVRDLVTALMASGARAALPVVVRRNAPLEFRCWRPGDAMDRGALGIPVPKEGETVVPDVALVPVLGYDRHCYRLGYGGGYFDRTLAALAPRPVTIGVGYELGCLETIHPQPHDVPLDAVVTEARLQRCRQQAPARETVPPARSD